jgi:hypothetical protein
MPLTAKAVRRWLAAAVSEEDEAVVAMIRTDRRPPIRTIWKMLVEAMLDPEVGCPHRPAKVQVRADRRLRSLGPFLHAVDIEFALADDLELIDDLYEQLTEDHGAGYDRSLLDMPGVTPRLVKSVFRSAASFYRRAPWKRTGNRVVRVEWPGRVDVPWFATVTGIHGTTPGLLLSESLETVNRIMQGNLSDKKARAASALAIVFGPRKHMFETDLEMVKQYKLPIAGRRAFPLFFRQEPGPLMRPPFDEELQLLDGCLRTMPRFLMASRRASARTFEVKVALPTGEVKLVIWRIPD